jgi:hypothetical protein
MPESTRSQPPRRNEDAKMADDAKWAGIFKRWAFLWPLAVGVLAVLGFKWVSPDARTTVLEAQMRAVPDSIAAALLPLKEAMAEQRRQDSLHRAADELRDAQVDRLERISRVQLVMQCAALSSRELQIVQALEPVCDRNSQQAGIPYRRGTP